ncbi:hypothetical protein D9M68_841470 [compost metagenome]
MPLFGEAKCLGEAVLCLGDAYPRQGFGFVAAPGMRMRSYCRRCFSAQAMFLAEADYFIDFTSAK